MNYYNKIKDILIKNETYKAVKDYSKNKSDLNSYFEVGKLLVDAQGGEERARYGNKLIKVYSERLTMELGKGYSIANLKRMRKYYIIFQKSSAMPSQLSWSHYVELLKLDNLKEINYYINIAIAQNLSYRELRKRIKANEYQRIGYKEELDEPKVNTLIKNPIIIKANKVPNEISEYALHQYILEDIDNFLKELGVGFLYYGHEVKIKIGLSNHSIDFLLFNYKFNCFVVVEIKVNEMQDRYIGQVLTYINYVDKYIKEPFNDKTVGVIICKKENKYIMDFCSDNRIFTTTYKMEKV